jgi:hypothetical protein
MCDYSNDGRLYKFAIYCTVYSTLTSRWKCQKLAAEQPLLGQAVQTVHHSTTHACRAGPLSLKSFKIRAQYCPVMYILQVSGMVWLYFSPIYSAAGGMFSFPA